MPGLWPARRRTALVAGRAPRVAFITDIPTPYRDPLLARIARRSDLEFEVIFCAATFSDRQWRLERPEMPARVLVRRGWVTRGETVWTYLVQPEICGLIWRGNYDLVIASSFAQPTSLMALAAARARGIPTMIVSESHARRERSRRLAPLRDLVVRWVLDGVAGAFAVGTLARRYLAGYGVPEERLFFFPNTPDVERIHAACAEAAVKRGALRASLGAAEASFVVLFVGRLIGIKDVATLLAAFTEVVRAHPQARLWICGDGDRRRALEAETRARGLVESVCFLGFRQPEVMPEIYAAADAFALPSRDEPWGVVVNEAAAAGLPLVTSDRVGAAADLIVPGESGHVFPAGDAPALAQALMALARDPQRSRAMGVRARERARAWGYDFAEAELVRGIHTVLGAAP